MKTNKLAIGLGLTILVALGGGGLAYAKDTGTSNNTPVNDGEQMKSQNKRHKTPHSERVAAAHRLMGVNQAVRDDEIARDVSEHGNKRRSK